MKIATSETQWAPTSVVLATFALGKMGNKVSYELKIIELFEKIQKIQNDVSLMREAARVGFDLQQQEFNKLENRIFRVTCRVNRILDEVQRKPTLPPPREPSYKGKQPYFKHGKKGSRSFNSLGDISSHGYVMPKHHLTKTKASLNLPATKSEDEDEDEEDGYIYATCGDLSNKPF